MSGVDYLPWKRWRSLDIHAASLSIGRTDDQRLRINERRRERNRRRVRPRAAICAQWCVRRGFDYASRAGVPRHVRPPSTRVTRIGGSWCGGSGRYRPYVS